MRFLPYIAGLLTVATCSYAEPIEVGTFADWHVYVNESVNTETTEALLHAATATDSGTAAAFAVTCRDWGSGPAVNLEFGVQEVIKKQIIDNTQISIVATRVDSGSIREWIVLPVHTDSQILLLIPPDSYSDQDMWSLLKGRQLHLQFQRPFGGHVQHSFSLMGFTKAASWVIENCDGSEHQKDPFDGYELSS